jgi:hypothetical protein
MPLELGWVLAIDDVLPGLISQMTLDASRFTRIALAFAAAWPYNDSTGDGRGGASYYFPFPPRFLLACSAYVCHNTLQMNTPDEAATNGFEPHGGPIDVMRSKRAGCPTSGELRSLKSLNNSKLPDATRGVSSISVLHLPCEFA